MRLRYKFDEDLFKGIASGVERSSPRRTSTNERDNDNDTFAAALLRAALALAALAAPLPALAQSCGIPGRDGPASLTGIVNTYYPRRARASTSGR